MCGRGGECTAKAIHINAVEAAASFLAKCREVTHLSLVLKHNEVLILFSLCTHSEQEATS